eukprot:TRINITY_DN7598_c0_g1_i1.p1 TRINITY_DN7598_c0_g1~~TRINITY_DN7598_c0_g1_i1.p1  ORF type:complete len:110 (-),score=2.86 TRINITY_DN7598_c0_g1_i1:721-1050(-)
MHPLRSIGISTAGLLGGAVPLLVAVVRPLRAVFTKVPPLCPPHSARPMSTLPNIFAHAGRRAGGGGGKAMRRAGEWGEADVAAAAASTRRSGWFYSEIAKRGTERGAVM